MPTNILQLAKFAGSGTTFSIATNSDWLDSIFFAQPGSPAGPAQMLGAIVADSATVTVQTSAGLIPGLPIVTIPGIPAGTFVGDIPNATSFNMVDVNGNPVNATITDAEAALTFEPLPLDLTGIEFVCNVRSSPGDPEVFLLAQTGDNSLINGGTTGVLSFNIKGPNVTLPPNDYVFDILAIADGYTINLFPEGPGSLTVTQGITAANTAVA